MVGARGALSERVANLCDALMPRLGGRAAEIVGQIRAGLDDPLRVAVTGRVNAGKSTLVNALLRQRVAATDVSECTRLVTWYRYGVPERVEIAYRDSPAARVALREDGRLPEELPDAGDDVDHLDVYLANDALRDMVLIDTPGLSSADEARRRGTATLLALDVTSRVAVAQADAVLYVLTEGMVRSEAEILAGFRETTGGLAPTALSAVAVLNKADHLASSTDWSLGPAAAVATRYASELRRSVAAVVPLVGLLAETVDCGRFREADADAIRALASLPAAQVDELLLSADRFVTADAPVPSERRAELLASLDLWGIARAVDALRAGDHASAVADHLRAASGIERLRTLLRETFSLHADVLKAAAAVTALERAGFSAAENWPHDVRSALRDELEVVDLDPGMHRLREVRALQEWAAGEVDLPTELEVELRRLAVEAHPAAKLALDEHAGVEEVRGAALEAATRWKQFANDGRATARQRWVADVATRSCELIWAAAGRVAR